MMDPNATLETIRDTIDLLYDDGIEHSEAENADHMRALIESVESLDRWLRRGGVLPADWTVPFGKIRAGGQS